GAGQVLAEVERDEFFAAHGSRTIDLEFGRQTGAARFERHPRHIDPERLEMGRRRQAQVVVHELRYRRYRNLAFITIALARIPAFDVGQTELIMPIQGAQLVEETEQVAI